MSRLESNWVSENGRFRRIDDRREGSLFTEEELSLQEYAFDEMNIVEMPIALLTRDTSGIHEIPLSADGQSRLVCANSSLSGITFQGFTRTPGLL